MTVAIVHFILIEEFGVSPNVGSGDWARVGPGLWWRSPESFSSRTVKIRCLYVSRPVMPSCRWASSNSTMKNVMMAPTPRHLTSRHMLSHELIACPLGNAHGQLSQISATNGATFIRHQLSRPRPLITVAIPPRASQD